MMSGFYDLSGVSTVIENLAVQLCKKAIDVTIGALTFGRVPCQRDYNVRILPLYNVTKLNRFLDSFDIIHNHHPLTNYLALVSRKPFIYHYHGAPDFTRVSAFKFSSLLSIKIMNHAFDAVIAVSESASNEFKRYFNINNAYTIYNGVDTDRFRPELKEKYRRGKPQFLFVGNLYKHKKVEDLLLALKELVKVYPKAYLEIVGDGRMYENLNSFITELKLENNVCLNGRVHDLELPYHYASCDVYVTASRWEHFGLPLLEAMACGKPVVASSISSHRELSQKSKAVVIYSIGNLNDLSKKMIETYKNQFNYKQKAIEFAKKYDWSNVAEKVIKIYKLIKS